MSADTFDIVSTNGDIIGRGRFMPGSKMTIDHGRVGTLKRREMFSRVTVKLTTYDGSYAAIPNNAILSPRRIQRALDNTYIDGNGADIADEIHGMLKQWADMDYRVTFGDAIPLLGRIGNIDIHMYYQK